MLELIQYLGQPVGPWGPELMVAVPVVGEELARVRTDHRTGLVQKPLLRTRCRLPSPFPPELGGYQTAAQICSQR